MAGLLKLTSAPPLARTAPLRFALEPSGGCTSFRNALWGKKNICTLAQVGKCVCVWGGGVGQLTQAAVQEQTSHESSHRHLAVSNVSLTMAHTRAQKNTLASTEAAPRRGMRMEAAHTAGCCHPRVSIATSEGGGALTAVWQARGVANVCARTSPHARTSAENSHWVMWCCEMFRMQAVKSLYLKKKKMKTLGKLHFFFQ